MPGNICMESICKFLSVSTRSRGSHVGVQTSPVGVELCFLMKQLPFVPINKFA